MELKIEEVTAKERMQLFNPNEAITCSVCHQKVKPPYHWVSKPYRTGTVCFPCCDGCLENKRKEVEKY